ncbi:MAG: type II toxin-antitoxin system RelB/DinJ family antitoxin [Candidatus Nanopelagicaceae bacterium]|jgi:DNA-damage-inducible protein J|nr:type II toxin-antitoxin system RelB/DinJ family antitoxin [Candidatus Nanopelagicaceae bacterium]
MATNTTLNVRIEEEIKVKASKILEASGLTASSAVRLFLLRVIEDEALPFDMPRPNVKTRRAIQAAKRGRLKTAKNSKTLVKDLLAKR